MWSPHSSLCCICPLQYIHFSHAKNSLESTIASNMWCLLVRWSCYYAKEKVTMCCLKRMNKGHTMHTPYALRVAWTCCLCIVYVRNCAFWISLPPQLYLCPCGLSSQLFNIILQSLWAPLDMCFFLIFQWALDTFTTVNSSNEGS